MIGNTKVLHERITKRRYVEQKSMCKEVAGGTLNLDTSQSSNNLNWTQGGFRNSRLYWFVLYNIQLSFMFQENFCTFLLFFSLKSQRLLPLAFGSVVETKKSGG